MAHSNTQFDKAQIDTVAGKHDAMVEDVANQLSQLRGQIEQAMAAANSDMTRALSQVYDQWSADVNKDVLQNVGHMATAMRNESNNQEMSDQDNTKKITSSVSLVGSFLSGP